MYEVFVTEHAKKNLAALKKHGKQTLLQIRRVLAELAHDPYGQTSELHAPLHAYRSLHVGRFRAVVQIHEKQVRVYVVAVGWHESGSRDDIYQQLGRAILSGAIKIEAGGE